MEGAPITIPQVINIISRNLIQNHINNNRDPSYILKELKAAKIYDSDCRVERLIESIRNDMFFIWKSDKQKWLKIEGEAEGNKRKLEELTSFSFDSDNDVKTLLKDMKLILIETKKLLNYSQKITEDCSRIAWDIDKMVGLLKEAKSEQIDNKNAIKENKDIDD